MDAAAEHPPADALLVVSVRTVGFRNQRHLGMVDEVLTDAGKICDAGNAVLLELIRRAGAGEHEELRRHYGAGCEDHLAIRMDAVGDAHGVAIGDADRTAIRDLDLTRP